MRVLVTGGGGYLGSVLVPFLLRKGHHVTVWDKFYFGDSSMRVFSKNRSFRMVRKDLRALVHSQKNPLQGFEAVVHLAAISNDPTCALDPKWTWETNVEVTKHLAVFAKASGIRRFLFASSCSVYGFGHDKILREEDEKRPVSEYARSKIAAEEALLQLKDRSFQPVVFRFATLFGASPRMRFDLAINLMTLNAVRDKTIFIMGGGAQWRPFVHVADVSELLERCLRMPVNRIGGEIFNIGSDTLNYRIDDLARIIAETVGGVAIEKAPDDPDRRSYRVCFEKAKKILKFQPKRFAEEGVREIAAAFRRGEYGDGRKIQYYNVQVIKKYFYEIPAAVGGEPIRRDFLPLSRPSLDEQEERAVMQVLRSGWLSVGPKTGEFEEAFRRFIGAPACVAVNSCTSALHLALLAAGIGPGDEVLVPAITFASTANVVEHTGAKPVFVDVDPETLNMDVADLRRRITSRSRAVICVHMAGVPCELQEIHRIARKRKMVVIEDAAHAVGSSYRGRPIGAWSDFTCFSFYPIKNMTTIEGGVLATLHKRLVPKVRRLALHGMDQDAWKRYGQKGKPGWRVLEAGYKYNFTDVQAALGLVQLTKLPNFILKRRDLFEFYDEKLSNLPGFRRQKWNTRDRKTNYHLYIVTPEEETFQVSREKFLITLQAEGIGTGIHFPPLHFHPYYRRKYRLRQEDFPAASSLGKRLFSIPLFPAMTRDDAQQVVYALRKVWCHFSKKEE